MRNITDHILDIVQNSIRAKATLIEIIVEENKKDDFYVLLIKDNGCGMDVETVKKAADPFFTSRKTRGVGLGLSLLKQKAEITGGAFSIRSKEGEGTEVEAAFRLSNVDRPPLGDIAEMFYMMMVSNEQVDFYYRHFTEKGTFEIRSEEIRNELEGVSLKQKEIKEAILELIKNNLKDIEATN